MEFQCELVNELGYATAANVAALLQLVTGMQRRLARLIKAIAEKKPYRATSTV